VVVEKKDFGVKAPELDQKAERFVAEGNIAHDAEADAVAEVGLDTLSGEKAGDASAGDNHRAPAHVLAKAKIGRNCIIRVHVFIESDVHVADRVTIKNGVPLWDGLILKDDVFVGPRRSASRTPGATNAVAVAVARAKRVFGGVNAFAR
jgi:NDP-sugar pyrophosphorylase family protein